MSTLLDFGSFPFFLWVTVSNYNNFSSCLKPLSISHLKSLLLSLYGPSIRPPLRVVVNLYVQKQVVSVDPISDSKFSTIVNPPILGYPTDSNGYPSHS